MSLEKSDLDFTENEIKPLILEFERLNPQGTIPFVLDGPIQIINDFNIQLMGRRPDTFEKHILIDLLIANGVSIYDLPPYKPRVTKSDMARLLIDLGGGIGYRLTPNNMMIIDNKMMIEDKKPITDTQQITFIKHGIQFVYRTIEEGGIYPPIGQRPVLVRFYEYNKLVGEMPYSDYEKSINTKIQEETNVIPDLSNIILNYTIPKR